MAGEDTCQEEGIPKEMVSYADEGISVNPEGCIRLFSEYKHETGTVKASNRRTKPGDFINGLPKFFQRRPLQMEWLQAKLVCYYAG